MFAVGLIARLSNSFPSVPAATSRPLPGTATSRRARRLTERELDELVRLRGDGWLVGELAEHFGIHRETVGLHLKRRSDALGSDFTP